jgi:undecaprenyl-diphosphatase
MTMQSKPARLSHGNHVAARHPIRAAEAELRTAEAGIRRAETRISRAEVPPPQEIKRGRRFVHLYVATLALALAAFIALALLARDAGILLRIDVPVTDAVQGVHLPLYGWGLTHASDLGFVPFNIVAFAAIGVIFATLGLRLEATLAVASSLLAGLTGSVVRSVIARARPSGGLIHVTGHLSGYSFPSGHVIMYTTLFGFAFYVVLVAWQGSATRNAVLALLALLVVLVGPSRVYLGQHWPSDVLGAYLLAGLWLAGTIELHLLLKPRLDKILAQRHQSKRQPRTV